MSRITTTRIAGLTKKEPGQTMSGVVARSSNGTITVFNSADGGVYACDTSDATYHDKNELNQTLRERLRSISPEALLLADALHALEKIQTRDVRMGRERILSGQVETCDADDE